MNVDYTELIIDSIDRLVKQYGQPIIDGLEVDWGQVICRMRLGTNWGKHLDFSAGPNQTDVRNCEKLENHEWPVWIIGFSKEKGGRP